jgi:hypothetical protein
MRIIKMKSKSNEVKKPEVTHPEPRQHEPVPVDTDHAVTVEAQGAVDHGFTKDQAIRTHETGVVEKGAADNRKIVKTKVAERHVQSEAGLKTAARRSTFIKEARKENEKVFGNK